MNEIRTFGIDRITDLSMGKLFKLKRKQFDIQLKNFKNIIGLDFEKKRPIKVRLQVNELHTKYMQSLPLHYSQVIHSKNENGQFLVDFFLVPNYEFITQVLKIGNQAVVLEPIILRKEIKHMLNKTLERYN